MTMLAGNAPLIIYVPGLLPKPEPSHHKDALFRCLTAGIRRIDRVVADDIIAAGRSFDVVSWTFDFYRVHRDFDLDSAAVDTVISLPGPSDADIREASSWQRRASSKLHHLVDRFPFLIPHFVSGQTELHLRDLHRYESNRNNIGEHTREMLKMPLRAAWKANRPILLIGHSMGSVIAYDSLWQMSRNQRDDLGIDLFLTMGSPLGQSYIQKHIMGHAESGAARYPDNVTRWINLAAVGDMTALGRKLRDDFGEMIELGLVDSIVDDELFNYYWEDDKLNAHAEYGYLVSEKTARIAASWWRTHRPGIVD
ncbi:MAG: hypothetical protein V3S15_09445 [Woeseiaceae bacterium]